MEQYKLDREAHTLKIKQALYQLDEINSALGAEIDELDDKTIPELEYMANGLCHFDCL